MGDLKSARLIYLKGFLFLFGTIVSTALLIAEKPTLKVSFLVLIAVWFAARFYYFVFYVIEHYVDSEYKFAGIWAFIQYLYRQRKQRQNPSEK